MRSNWVSEVYSASNMSGHISGPDRVIALVILRHVGQYAHIHCEMVFFSGVIVIVFLTVTLRDAAGSDNLLCINKPYL